MDVSVRTGSTKAAKDISLVSLSLESLHGERVMFLMEVTAREKESATIERESEAIVKHALLEAEGEAADRLDGALKELNGLLKGMIVSGAVHDVHMILAIVDNDNNLHVSHAGRAEAYLIRNGTASQITEYSPGKTTPAFVHIASGSLEPDDLVICSTQRLLRTFTPAQLAKITVERDGVLDAVARALEAEGEHASLCVCTVKGETDDLLSVAPVARSKEAVLPNRRQQMQAGNKVAMPSVRGFSLPSLAFLTSWIPTPQAMGSASKRAAKTGGGIMSSLGAAWNWSYEGVQGIIADLQDPKRKKRAHLLLIAGAIGILIILWLIVHLFTSTQRSKTSAELETLVEQISLEIQTAENRRLMGDTDAANAILQRAEESAQNVMENESGLFRSEANELLSRIRSKKEEINNIIRVTARSTADLSSKNPDILARGMINLDDGEFAVYDKQDVYRVLLNSVESPDRLSEDVLVVDGTNLSRFGVLTFLMNGNSVVEWQNGQSISMKTDDPRGWINGTAIDSYLRYIYILSPENNQIYKYERLNNQYGSPVEYNVNGSLGGAIDMSIDGNVYILKDDGSIVKLFRGEEQNFTIRGAPEGIFDTATKVYKVIDRNLYVLDPENSRVIVASDGGATGEGQYQKQYVFEGEQLGELQDLYVDVDEAQLYVMDEKRMYVVDLTAR